MAQYARREGLNPLTLAKWVALAGKAASTVKFAEVKLSLPAAAWPYEITLPSGIAVRAASAAALVQIVELIRK